MLIYFAQKLYEANVLLEFLTRDRLDLSKTWSELEESAE